MIEVAVVGLGIHPAASAPLLLLQEHAGNRVLSLGIGPLEAQAIALPLQGVRPPRPLTHDVFLTVIDRLGAQVRRVEITDLRDDTFHARLILEKDGQEQEIDIRPSDAIGLAVRATVPIFVAEHVLDLAGIVPEQPGEPEEVAEDTEAQSAVDESKLAPFKDLIDTLNLEGLDPDDPERKS